MEFAQIITEIRSKIAGVADDYPLIGGRATVSLQTVWYWSMEMKHQTNY